LAAARTGRSVGAEEGDRESGTLQGHARVEPWFLQDQIDSQDASEKEAGAPAAEG